MTNQIDAFKSDPTVNKSERREVIVSGKTLLIKGRETINVKLPYSNLRLYNALFISFIGVNLLSASYIVSKGFYAVHNCQYYIVYR